VAGLLYGPLVHLFAREARCRLVELATALDVLGPIRNALDVLTAS